MRECSSWGGGEAADAVMAAGPAHRGGGCHFKAAVYTSISLTTPRGLSVRVLSRDLCGGGWRLSARLTCRKHRFTLAAVIVDVVVSDCHVTAVARV